MKDLAGVPKPVNGRLVAVPGDGALCGGRRAGKKRILYLAHGSQTGGSGHIAGERHGPAFYIPLISICSPQSSSSLIDVNQAGPSDLSRPRWDQAKFSHAPKSCPREIWACSFEVPHLRLRVTKVAKDKSPKAGKHPERVRKWPTRLALYPACPREFRA